MNHLNKKYHHTDKHEQTLNLSPQSSYSRRKFLKHALTIGAAGLVAPGLLTACGSNSEEVRTRQTGGASTEAAASGTCDGSIELSASDSATRKAVNYVDESPQAGKVCANCRFFKKPETGAACGGCQIVSGPIAPEGYCTAWAVEG